MLYKKNIYNYNQVLRRYGYWIRIRFLEINGSSSLLTSLDKDYALFSILIYLCIYVLCNLDVSQGTILCESLNLT